MRPVILAAALFAAACNNPPPTESVPGTIEPEGEVAYTINDTIKVYPQMWESVMDRIPPEQRAKMEEAPGGLKRLEDQMAMSQVLYTKALEEGLADDPKIKVGLAMAERDYLAAMYVQKKGEEAVSDDAIAKAYEEQKVQYARPQVKARHILVKEEDLANEIKAKLDAGGDFAALAKEHSVDPGTKDKAGDLGWFEKRRMVPAFADAAFAAQKGETVGPVSTRFGFHIIEVMDRRESVPLEEVKDEIAGKLRNDAIQSMLQEMQSGLKVVKAGEEGKAEEAAEGAPERKMPVKAAPRPMPEGGVTPSSVKPAPTPEGHGKDDGHNH